MQLNSLKPLCLYIMFTYLQNTNTNFNEANIHTTRRLSCITRVRRQVIGIPGARRRALYISHGSMGVEPNASALP